MKKKCFSALALIASLALLTACGGSSGGLDLTAKWHKNTGTTNNITGTYEKLDYKVTFAKAEKAKNFYLEYDEGTYTTTLSYATSPSIHYVYKTELNISGRFYLNGAAGETFTDHLETETEFYTVDRALKPIKSVTKVHATCPIKAPYDKISALKEGVAYSVYDFMSTTTYNEESSLATTVTEFYTTDENDEPKTTIQEKSVKVKKSSFFDNNEIFFAIRGFKMNSAATFYSINPQTNRVTGVTMSKPAEITWTYRGADISAYRVTVQYNSSSSGPARTLVYAKASEDANNNEMRCVPLYISVPVSFSHGSLVYRLENHTFGTN